ncbi:potassium-transporting ATPase subunit KdpC [Sphingopyxis terrae]|uniref:potassium-transporting ATPase subunit KdpC n=1 Tax=Sphingopyxis terrae TaxID=33052 RepID=UPI002A0B1B98|nr:potassium-transporting ATPase subunit KdpC [Sphingopyxis terrae]MDX8357277.1 potassium-transporting ATPase subunit KdpC [Sphingopyxis terrae]
MFSELKSALRPALVLTALFALLLGLVYPLALTAMGQLVFPEQANGSLVCDGSKIVGSKLIGQRFLADAYFHGRPSAAGADGYDAAASSGSNLGPASKALADRVAADVKALTATAPGRPVPPDLVTTSASGLDPHISPEAAFFQIARVAKARGIDDASLRVLVEASVEHPLAGILGERRVNVLMLNRALDARFPTK